ncbi:hypothetical protein [Corynebacterium anserum]|uniref:Uncharacterized protein n=1 Tax=Corynebacterium anserum TaxID=2684406 RepID=A0A7G7YPW9_9CORY|nr:hypothetical protein [Corynebacterium anserum]MBC2682189.1 hypothetical protein [Corynebacterium anserum]QNH96539.1 hypothetical protein GP473_07600 [Corynebacterium anserum]
MSSRQNFITQFFSRIRNKVLTYTQVYYPGLAGKVVQSLTSGSSTKTTDGKKNTSTALVKQEPLPRYAPKGNGRTNGIIAAQAAAAPLPR